ncbi:PIN domain-containing protein [Corynebacterium sp. 22KM0430]|uniref:PIN domain-containing protein n=1 Tax=Corynebacterium sp. 22KM0430 TaxID=2989735 RepID=UPI0039B0B7D9
METRVLPDSNIWASATLHSWFALIAAQSQNMWSFYWTEDIMAEAVRARRRRFPRSSSKQIEDLRDRLLPILEENRISNYPHDDSVWEYPDPGDAHVHSAAVFAGIHEIVTNNVDDFRGIYSDRVLPSYVVYTADEWLMKAVECASALVDKVILDQCSYWERVGRRADLQVRLSAAGCPEFSILCGRKIAVSHPTSPRNAAVF